MARKAPRQPITSTAAASGVVASRVPAPPTTNRVAERCAKRASGYQRAITTIEPISPAAQPKPIKTRPAPSPTAPSASAKAREPRTARAKKPDMVRLGPKRSSSTPAGICAAAKARKKSPVITPIASAESDSSAINSGAMAALATR